MTIYSPVQAYTPTKKIHWLAYAQEIAGAALIVGYVIFLKTI